MISDGRSSLSAPANTDTLTMDAISAAATPWPITSATMMSMDSDAVLGKL
jgi:hypothetical protein